MRKFDPSGFYRIVAELHQTRGMIDSDATGHPPGAFLVRHSRSDFAGRARALQQSLAVLETPLTSIAVDNLLRHLEDSNRGVTWRQLSDYYAEIDSRLKDELADVPFLVIEPSRRQLYERRQPLFGNDVETRFPSVASELDEAAMCLALSRPTAAVFHLMRIMEIGLRSVAACIAIPPPMTGSDRNWGAMLRKINAEMDERNKGTTRLWTNPGDRQFFVEVYASLDAVRAAWRNATMHVERTYSDDEAEDIYGTVRGFMRKIASRFDERGQPPA